MNQARNLLSRLRNQWAMTLWLAIIWVALWGELSWANIIAGIVVALVVTIVLPMPSVDYHGRLHPIGFLILALRFAADLVAASIQVGWLAIRPRKPPRSAIIRVPLRSHSDLYMTLTADLCSLVPGSVIVEANRLTGVLYLHVLDASTPEKIEKARGAVLTTEERVMRAFASRVELKEAGLL